MRLPREQFFLHRRTQNCFFLYQNNSVFYVSDYSTTSIFGRHWIKKNEVLAFQDKEIKYVPEEWRIEPLNRRVFLYPWGDLNCPMVYFKYARTQYAWGQNQNNSILSSIFTEFPDHEYFRALSFPDAHGRFGDIILHMLFQEIEEKERKINKKEILNNINNKGTHILSRELIVTLGITGNDIELWYFKNLIGKLKNDSFICVDPLFSHIVRGANERWTTSELY